MKEFNHANEGLLLAIGVPDEEFIKFEESLPPTILKSSDREDGISMSRIVQMLEEQILNDVNVRRSLLAMFTHLWLQDNELITKNDPNNFHERIIN